METVKIEKSDYEQLVELKRLGEEFGDIFEKFVSDGQVESNKFLYFLNSFKSLLDMKVQTDELTRKFDMLEDVVAAMAEGDFSKRVDLPSTKTLFASLGVLMNVLAEELEDRVIKKHYLVQTIELLPDPVLITDNDGVIIFSNKLACALLNRSLEDVLFLKVANIFATRKQFVTSTFSWETVTISNLLQPYNMEPIPVEIDILELRDWNNKKDGFIYTIKRAS